MGRADGHFIDWCVTLGDFLAISISALGKGGGWRQGAVLGDDLDLSSVERGQTASLCGDGFVGA